MVEHDSILIPDHSRPASRRAVWLAGALVAFAALAAYSNSLGGPFVFDDGTSITANPTIRHLWPPWAPLATPRAGGLTVSGRPILNGSLAVNYALGGTAVRGYHAANLGIHILAALTLFGVLRRTLSRQKLLRSGALFLSAAIAALWAVHPLQTEAVTYVIQRAESLMGLFYLLTIYCFIRHADGRSAFAKASAEKKTGLSAWAMLSVLACFFGMGTKEVMVSAPFIVLLYDRTFFAGSFRGALERRPWIYVGLASTWIYLGYLVVSGGSNRGGSIGFGIGVGWWAHALTQFPAILRYLQLSIWPHPLVLDYEPKWIGRTWDVLAPATVVLALIAGTVYGLRRKLAVGFAGAFFFLILAPTSLMPAPAELIAEHRMYLPLAAIVTLLVLGLHALMGRRCAALLFAAAVACCCLTIRRNEDYRSAVTLWGDTVTKQPGDALAHEMYAEALDEGGRTEAALAEHETAVRIRPDFAVAQDQLADELARTGRYAEAQPHYEAELRLKPDSVDANNGLGGVLAQTGHLPEAISHYEAALRTMPDFAEAANNLAKAHYSLGNVYALSRRWPAATAEYEAALRIRPDLSDAETNLGGALVEQGRFKEAMVHYERALRLNPDQADVRAALAKLRQNR